VTLTARLGRYAAHEDPPAAIANLVALVVASNGPFYPATVLWLIGRDGLPSFWTLAASPLFAAIPWLMRRSSLVGRAALPLLGAANTVWTEKLFGPESGVGLLLLPCLILAALIHRPRERAVLLLVLGLVLAAYFVPAASFGTPLIVFTPDELSHLAALNAGSTATLTAFLAWQLAGLLQRGEGAERPATVVPAQIGDGERHYIDAPEG